MKEEMAVCPSLRVSHDTAAIEKLKSWCVNFGVE